MPDTLLRAGAQGLRCVFRREDNDRQLDSIGEILDGRQHRKPQNLPSLRVYEVDFPPVFVGENISYDVIAGTAGGG